MRARLEQVPEIENITRKLKQLGDENDQLRNKMNAYLRVGTTRSSAAEEEREGAVSRQPQIKSPVTTGSHLHQTKFSSEANRVLPNRPSGSGRTSANPTIPDYTEYLKYNGMSDYTTGAGYHFNSNNIGKRTKSADNIRIGGNYDNYDTSDADYGGNSNRNSRYNSNQRPSHDERPSSSNISPDIDDIMKKYSSSADAAARQQTPAKHHRRSRSTGGNFGKI